jgi:A/G-specific adenine glycosylase
MLQQTQVSRVLEYYPRFLARFPTVKALAGAQWREVLPLWRGLGYYDRGRNLLAAAKVIVQEFGGRVPRDDAALRSLPGIGVYTAAAIRSFAFGESCPAIDTNLSRVLKRVLGTPGEVVQERAEGLYDAAGVESRILNNALMDLGSAICRANEPKCGECPIKDCCHFAGSGAEAPSRSKRTSNPKTASKKITTGVIDVGVGCIHHNNHYLIAKRPPAKGGWWEFPGGKREQGETIRECLKREIREELGVEVSVRPAFHVEEWQEREFLWRLHFCRCRILRGRPRAKEHDEIKWIEAEDLPSHPFPKSNRTAVSLLLEMA